MSTFSNDAFEVAVITANHYGFGGTVDEALGNCRAGGGDDMLRTQGHIEFVFDEAVRLSVHPVTGELHWCTADGATPPKPVVTKVLR